MATIIGLKEFRENTPAVTKRMQGESFVVFKRSTPLFKLVPLKESTTTNSELDDWTTQAINRWRSALVALADE